MCNQVYHTYQCGCKEKGEFKQCNEKFDAQMTLQCAETEVENTLSRSYCSNHLPKEGKATVVYTQRKALE